MNTQSENAGPESRCSHSRTASVLKQAFAVIVLSVVCSTNAHAAIAKLFVHPGRPDSNTYILETNPNPPPGGIWYGRSLAFEALSGSNIIKKVIYTYYTGGDVFVEGGINGPQGEFYRKVSTDGGFTFSAPVLAGSRNWTPRVDFDLSVSIRRRNGTIFLMPNVPGTSFIYHTSTDNGSSWTTHTNGTVTANIGVWHRSILEENNGDLYSVAYEASHTIRLTKSTNGGVHWTVGPTLAVAPTGVAYNECCLERCLDGSWLCIFRVDFQPFKFVRSTNQGVSWTTPVNMPTAVCNKSVDPCLQLMPNGVLVFSYGRDFDDTSTPRYVQLAFSADGNGTSWTNVTTTFVSTENVTESAAYSCIWPTKAHSFIQSSDHGNNRNYWVGVIPAGGFYVWGRQVDVTLTNFEHRIDLKTKQTLVPATIHANTTMTYSPPGHPEGRSTGAIDGSTDYWSGAFSSTSTGVFQIDLQQNTTLNGLGVCLQYQTSQSATIAYSTNGTSWTTLKTYTNATHRAMNYTTFAPITARYVRATVTAPSGLACLGEIELYTNAMETFENSAGVPTSYSAPVGGFVARDGAGYNSERGLQMWDQSSSLVTCGRTVTPTATKVLEFWVKPLGWSASGGAIQARISSGATNVFRISIDPNGRVRYLNSLGVYVDTTGTGAPAGNGTVPVNVWSRVRLEASATTGTALLYVNGTPKGTIGKETTAAITTLNGFSFNSGTSAGTGDKANFDEVKFQ